MTIAMFSAQLGWVGKINRHIYKNSKFKEKIKIITLAQLSQAEKKKKQKLQLNTSFQLTWAGWKKCKTKKTSLQLAWAGQKNKTT